MHFILQSWFFFGIISCSLLVVLFKIFLQLCNLILVKLLSFVEISVLFADFCLIKLFFFDHLFTQWIIRCFHQSQFFILINYLFLVVILKSLNFSNQFLDLCILCLNQAMKLLLFLLVKGCHLWLLSVLPNECHWFKLVLWS